MKINICFFFCSCDEFIGQNIKASYLQATTSCLPINGVNDVDDVTTEIVCSNTGSRNSKIEVVEAYMTVGKDQVSNFVISFVPSHEIRVQSNIVMKRPLCIVTEDVCARTKLISFCQVPPISMRKKNIINVTTDRIYILSNASPKLSACYDTLKGDACCSYVAPEGGICRNFPTDFNFFDLYQNDQVPSHYQQQNPVEQQEEEHDEEKRKRFIPI